ncbi:hypothetical protein ACFV29_42055 [Streptomyces sp. NPDC059690]|uniref:hypothetical protein n=1 Tax=Streptomyces sp. NPDC059690 TaxID=3346907 RepID=UPI003687D52C
MTAGHLPFVFPPDVLTRLREAVDVDPDPIAEDFIAARVREALTRTEIRPAAGR